MSRDPDEIFLSKTLSWLLRHAACREGLNISSEGFIPVSEILNHRKLRQKFTVEDIKRIVQFSDKQRFDLKSIGGVLKIRANQGHTLEVCKNFLKMNFKMLNFDILDSCLVYILLI